MRIRKVIMLVLAILLAAAYCEYSYAAQDEDAYYEEDEDYEDEYEEEEEDQPVQAAKPAPSRKATALENKSSDTEKVLKSYGLKNNQYVSLLNKHKDAAKGQGNREKADRFGIIFREHPYDYLAAYRVAQANMNMDRRGQAVTWLNKVLKINPKYGPALSLMRKAKAKRM